MLGGKIVSGIARRSLVRTKRFTALQAQAAQTQTQAPTSGTRRMISTTGVIFDMDGTLTEEHSIDFKAMYDRIGLVKRGDDIITQVKEDVEPDGIQRAFDIIREEEMFGCDRMAIKSDFDHCIRYLADRDIRMAISTRNCREAYEKFAERAKVHPDTFVPVLDRDSLNGINKPDPRVAHHIMEQWRGGGDALSPEEVWFVGDSIDDIRCGKAAGCRTCLITASDRVHADEHLIDFRVTTLMEFVNLVSELDD